MAHFVFNKFKSPHTLLAHLEPVLQSWCARCVNPLKTICAQTIQNLVKVQRKQYVWCSRHCETGWVTHTLSRPRMLKCVLQSVCGEVNIAVTIHLQYTFLPSVPLSLRLICCSWSSSAQVEDNYKCYSNFVKFFFFFKKDLCLII